MTSTTTSLRLHIVTATGFADFEPLLRSIAAGQMPPDAVCIYPGTRNRLYRFATPHGDMVIKCFRRPGCINSVAYATVRRSKARRSFENSLRLRSLGIRAPQPVAYAEERRGITLRRSYYICRAVEGDTIRFYEMRPDCDAMLHALAIQMLRFHLLGVWHKDFSPGNVLVERMADGSYSFNYVDLNRMRFGMSDGTWQMGMFGRINYSAMHTARLAHAYASLLPINKGDCDTLAGLFPLLRADAPIWRGQEEITDRALEAFRRFWHGCARKHRLKHLLHPHRK